MTLDVKKIYLNTPMVRYKYVRIKIEDIPEEILLSINCVTKYQVTAPCLCRDPERDVWFATGRNISA
jgi:hypothetical protein